MNVEQILQDFRLGTDLIKKINGHTVTVFGSARTSGNDTSYREAKELSHQMSEAGFNVMTGGGPGIMEAANRGAFENGKSDSIGIAISLPMEECTNMYQTQTEMMEYFFSRKVIMIRYSVAFVVFPGGYGTLDELFEVLTLMQTGKLAKRPIYLYGKEFFAPLKEYIDNVLLKEGMISEGDENMVRVVDNPNFVINELKKLDIN
jgi:uncharacterized protein (TIGR00730 family)